MDKNIQKRISDITGVELMPGEPGICIGNGYQGFECCCDECDYYLLCFPEFDQKTKKISLLCYRLIYEAFKPMILLVALAPHVR